MGYMPPYIDEAGLHVSTYSDIRDDLVSNMKAIFPNAYLEPDAQDYQTISMYAEKTSDLHDLAVFLYNNRAPNTSIGGALDGVVKMNGIRRKQAGHSIATLTLTGKSGTTIFGGKVADASNNFWNIDGTITIPASGIIDTTATCDNSGKIFADIGTITRIITPTQGWISVTNKANAITGQEIEDDRELKERQKISVARPSRTVLLGIIGGIAELPDVTRYKVYENDTSEFGHYGPPIPGHSICAVIEGGDEYSIAEDIYYRKTPGTGTLGDISVLVTEEMEENPIEVPPIKFFRPKYVDVFVKITVFKKSGFVTQTQTNIIENVVSYLNSLKIGSSLVISAIYEPIWKATKDVTNPSFSVQSIKIGRTEAELNIMDIPILFNEVTRGIKTQVEVEVLT